MLPFSGSFRSMVPIFGAVPKRTLFALPSHVPRASDLVSPEFFLQNFRPLQSPFRVAARQNWLPVHFSTPMHIWRLRDVAATQRGACKETNQQTNKQTKRKKETTAGGSDPSATETSGTIKAKWIKHVSRKVTRPNVCDVLFITGGSVHHGNEENLPETESKCSMCQGQRPVQFPDVGLLPVHRGGFWVVSPPLQIFSLHCIQHLINFRRRSEANRSR